MTLKNSNGVRAILSKRHLELPRVLRFRISTPLNRIMILTFATTPLQDILYVELKVPLLVEKHRRRTVYQCRPTKLVTDVTCLRTLSRV
uniref:Uncharacterized protein n=1 Tax=Hyaloperonospora arabidopsidis (strain Emoy2) TaxID=559515 RepID=M4BDM6_HYAAE